MVGLVLVSHSPKIAEGTADLVGELAEAGIDFVKTEHLYTFDGVTVDADCASV